MLGFYLKMPSWVEGKLSTTRSQNSGFQLLVFGGGGWVVYFARIMGSALEKCLVALDTFVLFVGGFSPSASHVQLQPLFADRSGRRRPSGRLVCAASSEKPSAGVDLDLGILSSTCKISSAPSCKKDFQTSSRTSHPTTRRPRDAGPRASFADFETLAWPFNQWSGISILEVYIGLHMGANGQPLYPQDPYLSGSQKWVDWG